MRALRAFLRRHPTATTAVVLLAIVAIPVCFALAYRGFPVTDVTLQSKDVWVTNSEQVLAGRLNRQIDELNGATRPASTRFDVFQDGDDVFLHDETNATIERVDPALTIALQTTELPPESRVSYGADRLTVLAPDGELWVMDAGGDLRLDYKIDEPLADLGPGSAAVVAANGDVLAVSIDDGVLRRYAIADLTVTETPLPPLGDYELTAVGARGAVLDRTSNEVVFDDGRRVALPSPGLRIQQAGPEAGYVLVATGDGLLRVHFDGRVESLPAAVAAIVESPEGTSAPVHLDRCDYGAWAAVQLGFLACAGEEPASLPIPALTTGDRLEFRVNGTVIVLNNFRNGDTFLIDADMVIVDNWEQVVPPQQVESDGSEEESTEQTFDDAIQERTDENHAPVAVDDAFGVRPGRSTIMPLLANDLDVDGDVLTIVGLDGGAAGMGRSELIDGGRAVQFTPNPGASGAASFRYTVDDGRPGGIAEATVTVTVRSSADNAPPAAFRAGGISVELGQQVSYNVLADWVDPDGDDLVLLAAESASGDEVRFSADGFVSFRSTNGELGPRDVLFTVGDGTGLTGPGSLRVDVRAPGTLTPVGAPDFASTFVGQAVTIHPLRNDVSRSGGTLVLQSVTPETEGGVVETSPDQGAVTFEAASAGTYYLRYALASGSLPSQGMIRVDVREGPSAPLPPIAVKDIAYLRGDEVTTVAALQNDVSPSGRVLGIQSVLVPPESASLKVELLGNSVLRVSASPPIVEPTTFGYTISDGLDSSSATVTVVPVPPVVTAQAPVAHDDAIKVQVGDIASVAVLENDFSPDRIPFSLDPDLLDAGQGGLAFASGDRVRFQAPAEPGSYSVVYGITDDNGQQATARVTFSVLPDDENAPPQPVALTARVFAGSYVTVHVPLDGIDPDGDSVELDTAFGALDLGEVTGRTATSFTYQALPSAAGTDEFTYRVVDARGESAIGRVRIGVIPRGAADMQPIAVADELEMRPGRSATVNVLANDSDPNGYPISIQEGSLTVPDGISARIVTRTNAAGEVTTQVIEVEAGSTEGAFNIGYGLTNGTAGFAEGLLSVDVSATAPPAHPVAVDQIVAAGDITGATHDVDVLRGAENPGGRLEDLAITLEGTNADLAQVLADGTVRVTPGERRLAIAYRLTNTVDDLAATAFIIVPPRPDRQPPYLRPDLEEQVIGVDETARWSLADIVVVPSGRPAILLEEERITATHGNSDPVRLDDATLEYTPEPGYRGPASITFDVTDGSGPDDENGNEATLTLAFMVGDPDDVAPTFTTPDLVVAAGDTTVFDLRVATAHPDPATLAAVGYSDLAPGTADVTATLSGSTVTLTATRDATVGAAFELPVTLRSQAFVIEATVNVRVVSSLAPLTQTVEDRAFARRGEQVDVDVTANDVNPFPGEPLTVVDRTLENGASGASLGGSGGLVRVTTSAAFTGDVAVIYRVRDSTDDPTREVNGRLIVTVWDDPDQLAAPAYVDNGDGSVTFTFQPPASNNGSTITGYTVSNTAGAGTPCANPTPGVACTFTGLANGTSYSFSVVAHGAVPGSSITTQSDPSPMLVATPYATPAPPASATASNGAQGSGRVNLDWSATPNLGGGTADYQWRDLAGGGWNPVGASTFHVEPAIGVGNTASFAVRVCNSGGKCSAEVTTGSAYAPPAPPSAAMYLGPFVDPGTPGCSSNNCRFYAFTTSNFPAGSYVVHCIDDGVDYYQNTYNLPANGNVVLNCFLGDVDEQASVRIDNVNGSTYYSPSINWGW